METVASAIIKISVSIAIFYTAYLIIFRHDANFKLQRGYLIASMFLSLFMAFNQYSLRTNHSSPGENVFPVIRETPQREEIAPKETPTGVGSSKQTIVPQVKSFDALTAIKWGYLAVSSLLLLRIACGAAKFMFLRFSSPKTTVCKTTVYLSKKINGSACIFGYVFVNPIYLDNPQLHHIILHENIHASQNHSIDILLIELLAAAMWLNPFVWFLRRSLQQIHEYLADEGVLLSGVNKLDYQKLLVNLIAEDSLVLSSGFKSSIKKRFIMMTKTKTSRETKLKIMILLPLTFALLAAISLTNAPAQEKQSTKPSTNSKNAASATPSDKSTKQSAPDAKAQVKFVPPVVKETAPQEPPVAAISLDKMNVMYIGVDNPVTIAVANYNPADIKVTMTNGTLAKADGSYYNYIARPKQLGATALSVYAGEKLISKTEFRIKQVPDPVVKVAGMKSGKITKETLESTAYEDNKPFVAVIMENFDFNLSFTATEFTVTTVRNGQTFDEKSNTNRATEAQIDLIKKCSPGDKVYFQNIKCVGPDGGSRELPPLAFEIIAR